ncbi:5-methylcytosine restriction system specificity protein McrC [Adhaeribacter radiodurans]|uniref:5-methylcytosine-specific restriction endonuclease system specificity protein McrC n=1 Tax=Adhaeribacter radiodurans TaxID=2745197 RepID=A0A7L7LCU4_9BACT|nr:hypothetical protein [Adhaeribacter radiodurans]QMU30365.1 hypothetical protein HUW48_21110 [Adhaeribacter radiodurans]
MVIPIQNIYYLLSYAWDKIDWLPNPELVGNETGADSVNLLVSMLLPEVQHLLTQGLATDYKTQKQQIKGIKGKLLLNETIRYNLKSAPGQTICSVEELSHDIIPNQIIKTTLLELQQTVNLSSGFYKKINAFLPAFALVQPLSSTIQVNVPAQLPRYQLARYRFVLNCCTFIRQNLLPTNDHKAYTFKAFLKDKKQMAAIFEAFVRNFYRREQSGFSVKSERINWKSAENTEEIQDYLPVMYTDISLQSADRKIIIDTKFYKKALLPHHQKEKLHSKHLYQLFTYLQNSPLIHPNQTVEGILLYPVVNTELNLEYVLSGNRVRVCTINLNQPWIKIKENLVKLLD